MIIKYKLVLASAVVGMAAIADATLPDSSPMWEGYTLKGVLVAAVIYLVRELALERANNKAESDKREERMLTAIEKMSDGHELLVKATNEQTEYYRTIAHVAVEKVMKHGTGPM